MPLILVTTCTVLPTCFNLQGHIFSTAAGHVYSIPLNRTFWSFGCFLTILTAHFKNKVRSVERQRCTLLLTSAIAASGSSVHSLTYSNKSFHTDSGIVADFFIH